MEAIVRDLAASAPRAIGAILCDHEGEQVAAAAGTMPPPPSAERRAVEMMPQTMQDDLPAAEVVLRLAGGEPLALLRDVEARAARCRAGAAQIFELRFGDVVVLVRPVGEEHYLMLALRRPCVVARARVQLEDAARRLGERLAS